jgi:hypothetical protein
MFFDERSISVLLARSRQRVILSKMMIREAHASLDATDDAIASSEELIRRTDRLASKINRMTVDED